MEEMLSNRGAIITMITTMLGTGVTFMPCTFRSVGYVNAISLILFFGVATFFSCCSISLAAKRSKQATPTYSSLGSEISTLLGHVVNVSIFFNGYLAGINFYRYLSDLIVKNSSYMRNLADSQEVSRKITVLVLAAPFFYLLLKKTLSGLALTSYLCVVSISYLALLMIYLYATVGSSCADGQARPFNTSLGEGIPFFISSMVCQANMVKVYTEMRGKTTRDIVIVSAGAAIGGMLINGLTGFFGYVVFGESIRSEILTVLSDSNTAVNREVRRGWDKGNITTRLAVYGVMLVLFGGYPVQVSPVAEMIFRLLPEDKKTETGRKAVITVLFLVCMLLALVEGLGTKVVKTFSGATFSNSIAFVYPFVYYLSTRNKLVTIPGILCVSMIALSVWVSVYTVVKLVVAGV